MQYSDCTEARFIARPNRFIAQVELEGAELTVHVKNTGRCKELLLPGARVILCKGANPQRKTPYDLIAVYKEGLGWVNIDSQVPNALVGEWLRSEQELIPGISFAKAECVYGQSRMDFYFEQGDSRSFMEVKGCTLEIDGVGYFPDAPTERGVKHLHELASAVAEGYHAYLAFVIAMPGVQSVLPNMLTHPEFGHALLSAMDAGVKVLYLRCAVEHEDIRIVSVDFADPLFIAQHVL